MKILILANYGMGLYKFRKELIQELITRKNEVIISLPENDDYIQKLKELGCEIIESPVDRRGKNPLKDFFLLLKYLKIINTIKPGIVLTYTIKPNIYGGIACRINNTPYLSNITGLGTAIENKGLIAKLLFMLYKVGLKNSSCVFFQNKTNLNLFVDKNIVSGKYKLIPGSGVNLQEHRFEEYPAKESKIIKFLFIGRIMKAKGIDELIQAIKIVKKHYSHIEFNFIGGIEEEVYSKQLNELQNEGIIQYHGMQQNIHSYIKQSHATILPSYHEGLANVLLESASTGRPILASRIPGCLETFEEGESGFGFDVKSTDSLISTIEKFIELPYEQKKIMGVKGRRKVEKEYDRNIIVEAYMNEINHIRGTENDNEPIRKVG